MCVCVSECGWMGLLYIVVFFCSLLIELSPSSSFGIGDCTALNSCSGHGECLGSNNTCDCFQGWGHWSDITEYKAPDCSARTCPSHRAWAALPAGDGTSHGAATKKECAGRGECDRIKGECKCFPGSHRLVSFFYFAICLTFHTLTFRNLYGIHRVYRECMSEVEVLERLQWPWHMHEHEKIR